VLPDGHRPVALVTGAVHGLGRAVCRELARAGCDVAVNYRDSADDAAILCRDLIAASAARNVRARPFAADIADVAQAEALVAAVEAAWGRLDILVLAAGPFVRRRVPIADADRGAAAWRTLEAANVAGTVAAIAAALPGMRRRRFGRIVTFGVDGVGEVAPWPGRAAYAAAKAALWSYTRSLAREEAPHGITAHMIAPGNIVAPFKEGSIAEARTAPPGAARAPVGRPGSGEDVARVVRFLVDPDSDFLTGNLVYVGGGEDVVHRPPAASAGDNAGGREGVDG
jgi:3-oxoacyl-[acyl-carrier protein] reductase